MNEKEKQRNHALAKRLLSEQNFAAAVIAGAVATVLAAVAYGIVVAKWPFSHGFAAAGAGIVIGMSMGFLGRGLSTRFAVAAALYAIAGCVLGNVSREIIVQGQTTWASAVNVSFVGLIYWFVAVTCAVFFARRPLSRAEQLAIGLFESGR